MPFCTSNKCQQHGKSLSLKDTVFVLKSGFQGTPFRGSIVLFLNTQNSEKIPLVTDTMLGWSMVSVWPQDKDMKDLLKNVVFQVQSILYDNQVGETSTSLIFPQCIPVPFPSVGDKIQSFARERPTSCQCALERQQKGGSVPLPLSCLCSQGGYLSPPPPIVS